MSYKSVKDVVTMLLENGFVLKGQKGSHMKFEKNGRVVIVPNHKYPRYRNGYPPSGRSHPPALCKAPA